MTIKKAKLAFLLLMLLAPLGLLAQEAPVVGKWYFLTFNNSGNVITSHGEGAIVTSDGLVASEAQCWQLTGSDANGYTITDRNGLSLSVSATKSERVKAGKSLTATTFTIAKVTNGYEIRPKANASVAFNQFGGSSAGAQVGLWDAGNDPGNVILFKEARSTAEYKTMPRIIPWPNKITYNEDKKFDVSKIKTVVYDMASCKDFIDDFVKTLNEKAGISVTATQGQPTGAATEIGFTTTQQKDTNAYQLTVADGGISIKAGDRIGFFYALQTLKQLLPDTYYGGPDKARQGWNIVQCDIDDKPLLGHRGYMLDVARHFFSKKEVCRVLDIMAFYKMNRFHWHLTDDQGWRIEIPEYPKLTQVGARRSGSLVSRKFGDDAAFFDDTPYGEGMYFTLQDLKDVVAYASARGIEIMPEIDLPGHMVAALSSYPWLSCDSTKTYQVRLAGGISRDVLNIGDDRVIDFLKCVLRHVAETFPGKYIHLGGDECPTDNWKNNAQCLKRVQDEGLADVGQLQSWLVDELGHYLKDNFGKDIVVWDELLSKWNDKYTIKPVIMAWNGDGFTVNAANRGLKSIYVPYQKLYLDMMQVPADQCLVDEPYEGGWGPGYVNSVTTVYNANALQNIQSAGKSTDFVLGMQGNMWTESCNDSIELEYQLLPRLAALSETAWLPNNQKSWVSFYNRLQHHDEIYDALGYTYAKHYILGDTLAAIDSALNEANEILAATKAGQAGYATTEAVQALQAAVNAANGKSDAAAVAALKGAIATFKAADIVQPDSTEYYQIISASTFYRRPFAGSSLYQTSGDQLHIHYTRQDEPEELWRFKQDGTGRYLTSVRTGKQVVMGDINSNAAFADKGTAMRIDKATMANKNFTYVPGAVTLSAVSGYSAANTGRVKRLVATASGSDNSGGSNVVKIQDEPQLCMPGTWKLVKVDDFSAMLKSLVKKCRDIMRDNDTTKVGSYTSKAIAYLNANLVTPAANEQGPVTRDGYMAYLAVYDAFLAMPLTDNGPWATSFDRDLNRTSNRTLTSVSLGSQTITNPLTGKMYQNLTDRAFTAKAGQRVTPKFEGNINWMNGYVYIDRENDGTFSTDLADNGVPADGSDVMSYSFYGPTSNDQGFNSTGQSLSGGSRNVLNPPAFTVPTLADGFYMMRWKVDWNSIDPKGSTVSGNDIVSNGGDILDVRLRVYSDENVSIKATAKGGTLTTTDGASLNGSKATIGKALRIKATADEGYQLHALKVLHGILTGDSLKGGVAQRALTEVNVMPDANGNYTIPASVIDGDLEVEAVFAKLIFSDEFNQPGNKTVDATKWTTSGRLQSGWGRFITDSPDVAFVQDTVLVLRCIPNPNSTGDSDAMMSGAKETKNKFAFQYGLVEVRLKTTNHTGNFPAAWMMPQPPAAGWPNGGEIDIFESIDAENKSYHSIHTHYSYDLKNENPRHSGNKTLNVENWHVYSFSWSPTLLTWYVDGEEVFSYAKRTDQASLDQGQWPFDHPFYLILNQSVGDGSWAKHWDAAFTYETQVDYIRVWQTEGQVAMGIENVNGDSRAAITDGRIYDLQGRIVTTPARHGIYIQNGRKVVL